MKTAVVIPARLASTRLSRKVLKDIHGKPLIQWVYERSSIEDVDVFVATPDMELARAVTEFGGKTVLTGPAPTVLDRCSMAVEILHNHDNFIVVQGDEPTIYPEQVKEMLNWRDACMYKQIDWEQAKDPNTVKAVVSYQGFFRYLSRSVIPGGSPEKDYRDFTPEYYKQVCVMSFSREALLNYGKLQMCNAEKSEGIDLLRFLEHGYEIRAIETTWDTQAVDTQEDLDKVREMLG